MRHVYHVVTTVIIDSFTLQLHLQPLVMPNAQQPSGVIDGDNRVSFVLSIPNRRMPHECLPTGTVWRPITISS